MTTPRDCNGARRSLDMLWWVVLIGTGLAMGCATPVPTDVEVEVSRIALDPGARSPVIVLEDKAHTVALPIWIGPAEAHAIASGLEGIKSPRPLTHDLMKTVLDSVGVVLQRVVIRELRESTYFAALILSWNGRELEVDSRPSDAIALALRYGQPIYVTRAVLGGGRAIDLRGASTNMVTIEGVTVQRLSGDLAGFFELPDGHGVLADVSAAAVAPLLRGDIVLEVEGRPVRDPYEFEREIRAQGGNAAMEVQRDGERIRVACEPARAISRTHSDD